MPKKAILTVHPAFPIGEISPRLYGAFLEPIGNMVNGAMYNPKHPTADDLGFRRDYIDALKSTPLPRLGLEGFHRPPGSAEGPPGPGLAPVYPQRRGA